MHKLQTNAFDIAFCAVLLLTYANGANNFLQCTIVERHQYVNDKGMVNYKGFIQDRARLDKFLHQLSTHAPDPETWSKNERMVYWINAYNAFTIKLIIMHYPVKSIKDIGPVIQIPFVNTHPGKLNSFPLGEKRWIWTILDMEYSVKNLMISGFTLPSYALLCRALNYETKLIRLKNSISNWMTREGIFYPILPKIKSHLINCSYPKSSNGTKEILPKVNR